MPTEEVAEIFRAIRKYKPLPFFVWTGSVITAVGLGFLLSIFINFWHIGIVDWFYTLCCSVFLMLTGLLLFLTGILLDASAQ